MALAVLRKQSGPCLTPRQQDQHLPHRARLILEVLPLVLALPLLLSGCATSGVKKETGRKMDPPIEVVFYCLVFPVDPACRLLSK
jgi:hypothetical protein